MGAFEGIGPNASLDADGSGRPTVSRGRRSEPARSRRPAAPLDERRWCGCGSTNGSASAVRRDWAFGGLPVDGSGDRYVKRDIAEGPDDVGNHLNGYQQGQWRNWNA